MWLFADGDKRPLNGRYKLMMDYPKLLAPFKLKHSIELNLNFRILINKQPLLNFMTMGSLPSANISSLRPET